MGSGDPLESMPGTIRGDFSSDIERSILHGSHTYESAAEEINLWFNENELFEWMLANSHSINEYYY